MGRRKGVPRMEENRAPKNPYVWPCGKCSRAGECDYRPWRCERWQDWFCIQWQGIRVATNLIEKGR